MSLLLVNSNSLSIPLAGKSVHCVVTSPPYWGLRDYGVSNQLGMEPVHDCLGWATYQPCGDCYVCHMVAVFREVWRVLRDDGTLWLNLGDSYAGNKVGNTNGTGTGGVSTGKVQQKNGVLDQKFTKQLPPGLKTKDLVGIPWRVAFALQAGGWYLRSDCIWAKPNPMPESVKDRPTKAHEYIFLLAKRERYFYDNEAVKESSVSDHSSGNGYKRAERLTYTDKNGARGSDAEREIQPTRNRRTVWNIATEPTSEAHFATYPRKLVEPCIKAGCPVGGIVFDPFNGSGTTGIVARALDRHYIGCDLSFTYLSQVARKRLGLIAMDAWQNGASAPALDASALPLFQTVEEDAHDED